jgi:hypothetical protein
VPRNNRPRTRLVFEAARDYYGLNRASLRVCRGQVYEELLYLRAILERRKDPVARDLAASLLRMRISARSRYAGMARYFVYDEWKLLERE